MTKKIKKDTSLIFEILIVITSFIGLILNFKLFNNKIGFFYYTILGNLFCFVFYFIVLVLKTIKKLKKQKIYHIINGFVILTTTIVMIIYNFLILPTGAGVVYNSHPIESVLLHLVTPILVLINFCLNEDKKVYKKEYLGYWLIPYIVYGLVIIIYIMYGGTFLNGMKYPYPIFDIDTYGLIGCVIINLILFVFYMFIGIIIIKINNRKFFYGGKKNGKRI